MPESRGISIGEGTTGLLRRTTAALETAVRRRDSRVVFLGAAVVYLVLYLVTVGDLAVVGGTGDLSVRVVDDPSRAFATIGFFRFEAIAVLTLAGVTFLLSPLNVLVGLVLAALVGANLGLTYLGLVQPRACGLEASTGVIAGVPALLSGAACCGPTFLLLIGVQASATLITGFQLLVPLAVVMLVGSLLMIGRQVDPSLL